MYEKQLPSIINSLHTYQKSFQFKKRQTNKHTLKRTLKLNKNKPRILLQNYPRDRGNLFNELIPKLTTFPKKENKAKPEFVKPLSP